MKHYKIEVSSSFILLLTDVVDAPYACRLEEEEKKISSKMNDSLPIRFESMNNTQVLLTERNLSKKNTLCPLYMNFTLVSTVIKHVV